MLDCASSCKWSNERLNGSSFISESYSSATSCADLRRVLALFWVTTSQRIRRLNCEYVMRYSASSHAPSRRLHRQVGRWNSHPAAPAYVCRLICQNLYHDGRLLLTCSALLFSDSGLQSATNYMYSVTALDASGNESLSSEISVTTSTAPVAVLQATSGGGGSVSVFTLLLLGTVFSLCTVRRRLRAKWQ